MSAARAPQHCPTLARTCPSLLFEPQRTPCRLLCSPVFVCMQRATKRGDLPSLEPLEGPRSSLLMDMFDEEPEQAAAATAADELAVVECPAQPQRKRRRRTVDEQTTIPPQVTKIASCWSAQQRTINPKHLVAQNGFHCRR